MNLIDAIRFVSTLDKDDAAQARKKLAVDFLVHFEQRLRNLEHRANDEDNYQMEQNELL